jgi:hypothetical protein
MDRLYSVIEAIFEAAFYGAALLLSLAVFVGFGALIYFALKPTALWLWYRARRSGP